MQAAKERLQSRGASNPSNLAVRRSISVDEYRRFVRRYIIDPAEELEKKISKAVETFSQKTDLAGAPVFREGGKVMQEVWEMEKVHLECIRDPPEAISKRRLHTSRLNILFDHSCNHILCFELCRTRHSTLQGRKPSYYRGCYDKAPGVQNNKKHMPG